MHQLSVIKKSIMYKIISLGYSIYLDDSSNYIVNEQICSKCGDRWNNSKTQCFYCGVDNYHVYRCQNCNKLYSITNAAKKCSNCNSTDLFKICLNPDCLSNRNALLNKYMSECGGVFEKDKSASTFNMMRCNSCGNKSSLYKTLKLRIVRLFPIIRKKDVLYIKRLNGCYIMRFNRNKFKNENLLELMNYAYNLI